MTLNFQSVFEKIGLILTNGLRNRMLRQQGIDGSAYSRPKTGTLKARQRGLRSTNLRGGKRKGSLKSVPITRMVVTRDTALSAFESKASRDGLTVSVSSKKHRYNEETYEDLIRWNSRDTGVTNPNISNPPLIFPLTRDQVEMMTSEMETSWQLFVREAERQVGHQTRLKLKEILYIG